jgi:hypothetical protein
MQGSVRSSPSGRNNGTHQQHPPTKSIPTMVFLTTGANSLPSTTFKTILQGLADGTNKKFLVLVQDDAWVPNNLKIQILQYDSSTPKFSSALMVE